MLNIVEEVIFEFLVKTKNFITRNVRNFAIVIDIILPFLMLVIGEYVYSVRNDFLVGSELAIPIILIIISSVLKSIYTKLGNDDSFPVPYERFTHIDSEGVIISDKARYVDMVLYVSQVEDYLERHGKM